MQDGVLILSTGSKRRQWLWNAIASIRRNAPDLGIHILSDVPVDVPFTWIDPMLSRDSRWYKTQMHRMTPFDGITLVMDDDAVLHKPLPPLKTLLAGKDCALVRDSWWPTIGEAIDSSKTHPNWTSDADRQDTERVCRRDEPHHNSGVFLFRRTEAVATLMERWRLEWMRNQRCDQLPLCRALATTKTDVTTLPKAYNWITSKWGKKGKPYFFHFTHKDHMEWYYKKHYPKADKHALYRAYSHAVDNGQWDRRQYEAVGKLIHSQAPCRLLVWGCGHDSDLWNRLNAHGRTIFVETDPRWAKIARGLGCEVVEWEPDTMRGVPAAEGAVSPVDGDWDVIIIDGPPGHSADCPGRELPIRWASETTATVILHDVQRPWERWCIERYMDGQPSVVAGKNGTLGIWQLPPL